MEVTLLFFSLFSFTIIFIHFFVFACSGGSYTRKLLDLAQTDDQQERKSKAVSCSKLFGLEGKGGDPVQGDETRR